MEIKSAETRDVIKTRTFVTLKSDNGNEDEFRATKVLKFVKDIMGTDGYMEALISLKHTEKKIAEKLESDGLVAHSQSKGWYEDDRERINELWKDLMVICYDNAERDELDVSMVR